MGYYTAAQRIKYYKEKLAFAEEENERMSKHIDSLLKENNQLRLEINVLRNKSNEEKHS